MQVPLAKFLWRAPTNVMWRKTKKISDLYEDVNRFGVLQLVLTWSTDIAVNADSVVSFASTSMYAVRTVLNGAG
jgi:hypothetical protein